MPEEAHNPRKIYRAFLRDGTGSPSQEQKAGANGRMVEGAHGENERTVEEVEWFSRMERMGMSKCCFTIERSFALSDFDGWLG